MSLFGLRFNVLFFAFVFYILSNVLFNLGLSRTLADVLASIGYLVVIGLSIRARLYAR